MKVDPTCPLELWAYALPGDDTNACTLHLFNLDTRVISSLQLTLTCYDSGGQNLFSHTERPMALNAGGKQSFELLVPLEQANEIDSLSLMFEKVWFEDGSDWRRVASIRLLDYTPNELPMGRDLENLRYVAGPDAVGYPEDQGAVWLCVCGRVNVEEENSCRRCGRDRAHTFLHTNPEVVREVISNREQELEIKSRSVREEASRQEFLRQDALKRREKSRRRRWIGATVPKRRQLDKSAVRSSAF